MAAGPPLMRLLLVRLLLLLLLPLLLLPLLLLPLLPLLLFLLLPPPRAALPPPCRRKCRDWLSWRAAVMRGHECRTAIPFSEFSSPCARGLTPKVGAGIGLDWGGFQGLVGSFWWSETTADSSLHIL
jgi:hypothetical protein